MEQQIERLRDLVKIQCSDGNWNYSDYMRGMANGLIIALAVMENKEPKFFDALQKYKSDKDADSSLKQKINDWLHKAWH